MKQDSLFFEKLRSYFYFSLKERFHLDIGYADKLADEMTKEFQKFLKKNCWKEMKTKK